MTCLRFSGLILLLAVQPLLIGAQPEAPSDMIQVNVSEKIKPDTIYFLTTK